MRALSAFWEQPKSPESLLLSDYLHALDQAEQHVDILNYGNWCSEATFISLKTPVVTLHKVQWKVFQVVCFGFWDAEIWMKVRFFFSWCNYTTKKVYMYTCSLRKGSYRKQFRNCAKNQNQQPDKVNQAWRLSFSHWHQHVWVMFMHNTRRPNTQLQTSHSCAFFKVQTSIYNTNISQIKSHIKMISYTLHLWIFTNFTSFQAESYFLLLWKTNFIFSELGARRHYACVTKGLCEINF